MASKNNSLELQAQTPEKEVVEAQISSFPEKETNTPEIDKNLEFDGDIDLSVTRKKRFRIDRDNNRFLELNVSDMGILTRLDNLYPKLEKLSQDASLKQLNQLEESDERVITKLSNALIKIDMEMRKILDEIFDSNVSEICAPNGTLFDPFNGEFRFEHIIDVLTKLYENNLNSEFKKMSAKIKKKTSKYTKGN